MRDLSLLLDFDEQYRRDRRQDPAFLHRRDRRFALDHEVDGSGSPVAWLREVRGHALTTSAHDPRLRVWRVLFWGFVAVGSVLGVLTMLGLLYYDGGRRISVPLMLGVALLQLLLALATTAQALIGWRPWHGLVEGMLPGRFARREAKAPMLRAMQAPLAARAAQGGGLAFAVTALLTLLTQVLIHDLAFGWSTTLQTSGSAFHALTSAVAWPWHAWLPQAVPSLELVEQSRYFRAGGRVVSDPARLGNWWRFLAMAWLGYVVVPRLLLWQWERLHVAWRARRLLARHPGRAALRERCATPWVEHAAPVDAEDPREPAAARHDGLVALRPAATVIRWAGAGDDVDLSRHVPGGSAQVFDAGGAASLDDDAQTVRRAAAVGGIATVLVRGWEPPTGELADFLAPLCDASGITRVQLLPLAAGDGPPAAVGAPVLAQWHRFVERLDAPALVLADVVPQETSA